MYSDVVWAGVSDRLTFNPGSSYTRHLEGRTRRSSTFTLTQNPQCHTWSQIHPAIRTWTIQKASWPTRWGQSLSQLEAWWESLVQFFSTKTHDKCIKWKPNPLNTCTCADLIKRGGSSQTKLSWQHFLTHLSLYPFNLQLISHIMVKFRFAVSCENISSKDNLFAFVIFCFSLYKWFSMFI